MPTSNKRRSSKTITIYGVSVNVDVDVDVDLDEIDTDDLIEELRARGVRVDTNDQDTVSAEQAYFSLTADTPERVRRFVTDAAGRIA